MTQSAQLAIQCKDDKGKIGTFLYRGNIKKPEMVSPTFDGCTVLFEWCAANGWIYERDERHPVGNYVRK